MSTITIEDVPPVLHRSLKSRAQAHGRSFNKEIIVTLGRSLHGTAIDAKTVGEHARAVRETTWTWEWSKLARSTMPSPPSGRARTVTPFPAAIGPIQGWSVQLRRIPAWGENRHFFYSGPPRTIPPFRPTADEAETKGDYDDPDQWTACS